MTKTPHMQGDVTLGDKFDKREGRIYISGIQALVRLTLMQRAADAEAGLNTAGFVSGYRGSPLGGIDAAFMAEKERLKKSDIVFQAGLNEAVAATSVRGTQELKTFSTSQKDGVFGIWYGKAPGVDQALDAIRHAHAAGTSVHGGVLAIAGDDHSASSSTLAAQTDLDFIAAGVPVLYPSGHDEFVRMGRLGIEMSRFSGGWVALKTTADTVEGGGSIDISGERFEILTPDDFTPPPEGLHMMRGDRDRFRQSTRVMDKLAAAERFARANHINVPVFQGANDVFGIVASGKAYRDVRQALYELGLDDVVAARKGIRLYKVGMVYPLEKDGMSEFCRGMKEILVVEEGRPILEDQMKSLLYGWPEGERPAITGKMDAKGAEQFPIALGFSPAQVAKVIAERLLAHGEDAAMRKKMDYYAARLATTAQKGGVGRIAHFCSGCPHSRSTTVPEGSRALGGIGCHIMAVWNYDRNTNEFSQMGGEGASWIGQAPFSGEKHIFSNLGDGTYQHSGSLAIRANVLAGHNITYKILYNDAVAMTGGQKLEGGLDVPQIVAQVMAEGVTAANVVVVSETPKRFKRAGLPKGVAVRDRKDMDAVQRQMTAMKGVSVLIYDQECAAEKRRKRKRGLMPDPDTSIMINHDVCEGCGDCSKKSNCVSIVPVETELGRKRGIDQTNCNKDYSCIDGFCPSFIAVKGGKPEPVNPENLIDINKLNQIPEAICPEFDDHWNIVIGGVGGTGIITLSAIMGMAAHLEGKANLTADVTGIAQKGGAVFSHVRIGKNDTPKGLWSSRIISGGADVLLACDDIVSATAETLDKVDPGRTAAVVNIDFTPTLDFTKNGNTDFQRRQTMMTLKMNARQDAFYTINALKIAAMLAGDAVAANIFMLGYAYQKGLVPLKFESIAKAVTLNGVAVKQNLRMLQWGRLCAHDPQVAADLLKDREDPDAPKPYMDKTLSEILGHRTGLLTDYQNAAYAGKYAALVERVRAAETAMGATGDKLAKAVAHNYAKLLAYKDEYEVARLHSSAQALARVKARFGQDAQMAIYMSPPLFARRDKTTGEPKKYKFGPWILPVLGVLKHFKSLRGTMFDPFGHTTDRKMERSLIKDYEADIEVLLSCLNPQNHKQAVAIARIPEDIRGFGHVKEAQKAAAYQRRASLLTLFDASMSPQETAAAAIAAPAMAQNK